jgi:hypothetical protein
MPAIPGFVGAELHVPNANRPSITLLFTSLALVTAIILSRSLIACCSRTSGRITGQKDTIRDLLKHISLPVGCSSSIKNGSRRTGASHLITANRPKFGESPQKPEVF